jgi:hypothetical protein
VFKYSITLSKKLLMLTIPISLTIVALFWFTVDHLAQRKQMKAMKIRQKFITECQAPVISLADGRKLKNVASC